MLQINRRLYLLVLVFLISTKTSAEENWLNKSFIEQAFIHVALRNEYSSGEKPLVKWHQPIKIWVEHKVADEALHDQLVNDHLKHLAKIINHPIYRVDSRSNANVIWVFSKQASWREDIVKELGEQSAKHMFGAVCQAGYKTHPRTHEIVSAAVIIPVDQARSHGKLLACIVEEITQALGLPNDSEYAYPSIFNDKTPQDLLSPLDVVLLQLLYSSELTAGMTESQARPVVRQLLKRYEQQGLLQQALRVSNAAPLKQWMH